MIPIPRCKCILVGLTVISSSTAFTSAFSSISSRSPVPFVRRTTVPTNERTIGRNLSQNDQAETQVEPPSSPPEPPSIKSLPELFPLLSSSLRNLNLSTPTPIQTASAPLLSSHQTEDGTDAPSSPSSNALLIAPTGSGKTLAYLLPTLTRALSSPQQKSSVLIVAPTRELAVQLARDAADLLTNLDSSPSSPDDDRHGILLAIRGIDPPAPSELSSPTRDPTVLIGTPEELTRLLSTSRDGGIDFLSGDRLDTIILDEVDVLLPNPPKHLRTSLDRNARKKGGRGGNDDAVREERRKKEARRKRNAAKRGGTDLDTDTGRIVAPTETLLRLVASRRFASSLVGGGGGSAADAATSPYRVIAGSATASRRTLDNLNRVLRVAAEEGGSSSFKMVWDTNVVACRPAISAAAATDDSTAGEGAEKEPDENRYAIRAVTVPKEVTHRYIPIQKEDANTPATVLQSVARAAVQLRCETSLLFLCGEFAKTKSNDKQKSKAAAVRGATAKSRRNRTFKQKKMEKIAASREKGNRAVNGLSARKACSILGDNGIRAEPLHVALGLEQSKTDAENESDEIPPFLVTFEGSARGLHFDGVDAVFIVGRPSSAASYLHLAGRVGRSVPTNDADADGSVGEGGGGGVDSTVMIRPGTVVSICTEGSSKELEKWTRQIGGTDLEKLVLED